MGDLAHRIRSIEKGMNVIHIEHAPKSRSTARVLVAPDREGSSLGAFAGRGAGRLRFVARVGRRGCILGVFLLALAVVTCSPALASTLDVNVQTSDATATSVQLHGGSAFLKGVETAWRFEYSTSQGGPWTNVPGGGGAFPPTEAEGSFVSRTVHLTGLTPAKVYYVRFSVENEDGDASAVRSFETVGPPVAMTLATHAFDGEEMRAIGFVNPYGAPASELQTVTVAGGATGGTFKLCFEGQCTGAAGTGTLTDGSNVITALHVSTGSFLEGEEISGAGIPAGTSIVNSTEPDGVITTLELSAAATESRAGDQLATSLAFTPLAESESVSGRNEQGNIEAALDALPNVGKGGVVVFMGAEAGSYTVEFAGSHRGVNLPAMTADPSGLTPSGTVTVTTLEAGAPFDVHYHFEYVDEARFQEDGFAGASTTPEVEGSGPVGEDLPGLQSGQRYHYRLVATSTAPGDPVVEGEEQTLTVPVPGQTEAGTVEAQPSPCPNEALRGGHSAHLPDCRAYEQVTPENKEGAQDVFKYGISAEGSLVGEDGEHFMLHAPGVQWGPSPDARVANYFFTRTPSGWRMTSTRPEGEAGPYSYQPFLFSPDLTQVGLEVEWDTTEASFSPNIEMEAGPPGGPYVTAASIPRGEVVRQATWVAASADGSKLILQTGDHSLLGHATGTVSGDDLYEFSGGQLRQLNVLTGGGAISSCGAKLVDGFEDYEGHQEGSLSSPHAVSADGSRVFFEDNCTHDLYMRANGAETVDLGEYLFLAANAEGSKVLLERHSSAYEALLYEVSTGGVKPLFSAHEPISAGAAGAYPVVSEDLSAIYFMSGERLTPEAPPIVQEGDAKDAGIDLYRYDIVKGQLRFVVQTEKDSGAYFEGRSTSPDGRYYYWISYGAGGVPGGAAETNQVYRYDSLEDVVQCMSCASSFDPRPQSEATFLTTGTTIGPDNVPNLADASSNGDFVFFDTPAALVPEDVDGEAPIEGVNGVYPSIAYSLSSDVYEWRKDGVDGCAHVQGCLALISSGTGGYKNEFLGTTPSGRDVSSRHTNRSCPAMGTRRAMCMTRGSAGGSHRRRRRPWNAKGMRARRPRARRTT